jgi:hypothetical protein
MSATLFLIVSLCISAGGPLLSAPGEPDSLPVPARPEQHPAARMLSPDEFVTHFVALSNLLNECDGDWELFRRKRDEYLSRNGVTEEDMLSFVNSHPGDPEFWSQLWERINRQLKPAETDTVQADTGLTPTR